jgi:predicted AlkP superfamily phosphohydrolase/phosphomutase/tetratricopeptide (TPR) repeat protein
LKPVRFRGAASVLLLAFAGLSCGRGPEPAAKGSATSAAAPQPRVVSAPAVDAEDVGARNHRPAGGRAPVIWLGLDALDWDLVDRLASEGKMPNWKRLTEAGYTARLHSFMPLLSPIIWTTLATGVGPEVHRVLDFQEVDPATGQKVPISGLSRAVPAIWNVASASGRTVGVVGWWASHPAEEVEGFFVSDHVSPILFDSLPRAGAAFPVSLSAGIEQIAARDGRVSDADLTAFVDMTVDQIARERSSGAGLDNRIVALARIVGATRVQQRIARELYDRNLPDLMMVYLEGTDAIGHVFAPFVPPRMSCVSDQDYARYRGTADAYHMLIDRIIGQWMRRADEDGATLIVNSDHGFKWGDDRSCERASLNPGTAGFWHRMEGVFAAYGARVHPSRERGSASMFDVEPTVAALLELPVDRRETGKVIRAAFPGLANPPRQDLFARVAVRRLEASPMSEKEASEYTKKLLALGYLSGGEPTRLAPEGGNRPGMTEGAWNNLGLYFRETTHDLKAAEPAFRKSLQLRPGYASPEFNLAVLYRMRGDDRRAIDGLFESLTFGHADPEGTVLQWYDYYEQKGKQGEAREVLERGSRAYPASEPIAVGLGLIRFRARDCPGAYEAVARFEATSRDPRTLNTVGLFQTCLGHREAAVALFRKSLQIRPDQPAVVQSLNLLQRGAPPGP